MLMALISLYLGGRGREGWALAQGTHRAVPAAGRAVPSPQCSGVTPQGSSPAPGSRYSLGCQATGAIFPVIGDVLVVVEERSHLLLYVALWARGS